MVVRGTQAHCIRVLLSLLSHTEWLIGFPVWWIEIEFHHWFNCISLIINNVAGVYSYIYWLFSFFLLCMAECSQFLYKSRGGSGSDVAIVYPWNCKRPRVGAATTFQAGTISFAPSRGSSRELILRGPHPLRHPVFSTQGEQPRMCAGPSASPALTVDGTSSPCSGLQTARGRGSESVEAGRFVLLRLQFVSFFQSQHSIVDVLNATLVLYVCFKMVDCRLHEFHFI